MNAAPGPSSLRPLTAAAMSSAAVIMAYQVASRATRDTLFLSSFPVTTLPLMVALGSALAILMAVLMSGATARYGPARVVPAAFLGSALLTLAEWALVRNAPRAGAIAVYLHVTALGPMLISGFWLIVAERFDPRSAKRAVGRIAGVGTIGGLLGGVLAERLTTGMGLPATLPALALAHGWCAWSTSRLPSSPMAATRAATADPLPAREAHRRLLSTPYLRNLALLVVGSSVSAALLDYVFKAGTIGVARHSLDLMRVFSLFYAGVAVLTLFMQALVARPALERVGLARTIGTLPGAVVAGGVAALVLPGALSVSIVRGVESVLRGSLFRSGYELLYTPIPEAEKRATKTLVDVGCDRLGDMLGAGLIALVLMLAPLTTAPVLLGLAVVIALITLSVVARLQRGYVASLEAGLRAGALRLDQLEVEDSTTRSALQRTRGLRLRAADHELDVSGAFARPAEWGDAAVASDAPAREDLPGLLAALRSDDAARVGAALAAAAPLDPLLVSPVIGLLARDEVARAALDVLRPVADRHVGQLVDALLDPDTELAVRRRIPRLLADCASARAVDGLTRGLADGRFGVRYRCGRALARVMERNAGLERDADTILGAVRREATLGRDVWDSQRELDRLADPGDNSFVDEFLRERAGRSLEHVFTLLSLVLPREPLQIAFRGLHADDRMLRGTALEYLESVLPPAVRDVLWPYLEPNRGRRGTPATPPRDREQVLSDLMRSNQSIAISLEALRLRLKEHEQDRPESG